MRPADAISRPETVFERQPPYRSHHDKKKKKWKKAKKVLKLLFTIAVVASCISAAIMIWHGGVHTYMVDYREAMNSGLTGEKPSFRDFYSCHSLESSIYGNGTSDKFIQSEFVRHQKLRECLDEKYPVVVLFYINATILMVVAGFTVLASLMKSKNLWHLPVLFALVGLATLMLNLCVFSYATNDLHSSLIDCRNLDDASRKELETRCSQFHECRYCVKGRDDTSRPAEVGASDLHVGVKWVHHVHTFYRGKWMAIGTLLLLVVCGSMCAHSQKHKQKKEEEASSSDDENSSLNIPLNR